MKKLNTHINILRRSCRLQESQDIPTLPKLNQRIEVTTSCKRESGDAVESFETGEKKQSKSKRIKTEVSSVITDVATTVTQLPEPDGFLDVDEYELDLERTLLGGQSFRWTKKECSIKVGDKLQLMFSGIVCNQLIDIWRISPQQVAYRAPIKCNSVVDSKISSVKTLLEDYFRLNYKLRYLYKDWSSRDSHLAECCQQYTGFRILRQDPVENVFSFICATNNNIKRISQMVDKLCKKFGENLGIESNGDELFTADSHHAFPTVERLAENDVFDCLRYELGFGYRAKFIHSTANQIVKLSRENDFNSPRDYLLSLRELPYQETRKRLVQFDGIGRKVADCICLMSMDHLNSVPIDCHIYGIVCRHYMPNLKLSHKTLNDTVHDLIGEHFKNLHGPLAGWSTSVLFIAELKHLKLSKEREGRGNKKTDESVAKRE